MSRVEKMRAFIIKFLFLAIVLGIVYVIMKYAMPFLMPFLIAFLIAFLLKPIINFVVKKTKLSRNLVAVLTLIVFYIVVSALITVIGTNIVTLIRSGVSALPTFYNETIVPALTTLQDGLGRVVLELNPEWIDFINASSESITSSLSGLVSNISGSALATIPSIASKVPSALVNIIITIVASFFLVIDYYRVTSFIARQMPLNWRQMTFKIKDCFVNVIFKFGRAYCFLMCITFAELFVGLLLLGVDNAFLIALVTAAVDILPILGTGTIIIPWAIGSLLIGRYPLGIGLIVLYAIITIVRQILEPRIVGKQIGLYPLVTLICMFTGAYLMGAIGMFGLPILVTILVQLDASGDIHIFKK